VAALAFRPGGASRGRGQRTPWSSPGGGERGLKRSILVHILLNKEPTLVAGQSKTAFGGNRNQEESGGIWRNPGESGGIRRNPEESGVNTGNPVPQEFLQKDPVTAANNRNSCAPLQNHAPVKNSSRKHRKKKKSSGILFFSVFEPPK
jgi:hypothetical protein